MIRTLLLGMLVAGCAYGGKAAAQHYPDKPVRIITVGSDPAMPRILAQDLSITLGQQFYVEERAGASGTIGAEVASRAPADGYTLLVVTSTHMVTPYFYKLSYNILRDFEPVSLMATSPFLLLAHPSLPASTVRELIALAKANPGRLNYSATAAGSSSMLPFELFNSIASIKIMHVPYKSVGSALIDAVAGQVPLVMSPAPSSLVQVTSGRLRALAVTTPKRTAALPNAPTFAEQGIPIALSAWFGISVPIKTPPDIIGRLNTEIVKAMRKLAIRERVLGLAMDPGENSPAEFMAFMKEDFVRWTEAVKAARLDNEQKQ